MTVSQELLSLLLQVGGPLVAIITAYWKIDNKVNKLEATHDLRLNTLERKQEQQDEKLDKILEEVTAIKILVAKNSK